MNNKNSKKRIKTKLSHLRLVLPCLLVAVLVLDGLMGYTAPDPFNGIEVVTQKAYAAEPPELEIMAQTGEKQTGKGPAAKLSKVAESGEYADGVYTGSARGFGGSIRVEVTVRSGKIAGVKILSASGETGSYLARAKAVIRRIVSRNSTNVDAVSGATYSSNGIIKAVRSALNKARKKKTSDAASDETDRISAAEQSEPVRPQAVTGGSWEDGVYTGEGEGFSGKLHVQVQVTEGKITSVELIDTMDDEEFMTPAKEGVFESVLSSQGTDVDSITGATFSSYGLIEAINDALSKAVRTDDPQPDEEPGEGTAEDGTDSPVTETITRTGWVYYDDDEDFDDYQLTVTFTVTDGAITQISDYSQTGDSSNNSYIRSAVRGINDQLSSGTSAENVDSVTGATCTSTAIKNMIRSAPAVKRAMSGRSNDAVSAAASQNALDAAEEEPVPDKADTDTTEEVTVSDEPSGSPENTAAEPEDPEPQQTASPQQEEKKDPPQQEEKKDPPKQEEKKKEEPAPSDSSDNSEHTEESGGN